MLERIYLYSIAESLGSGRARHAQGRVHIKMPCEGPRHIGFGSMRGALWRGGDADGLLPLSRGPPLFSISDFLPSAWEGYVQQGRGWQNQQPESSFHVIMLCKNWQ